MNWLLTAIGGWHVGCYNAVEAREAVEYVERQGYVGRRMHYAPMIPEGVEAYELTDEGLAYLRRVQGEKAFQAAGKMRKWYRDRVKALEAA
jgi:hypothetical protein